VLHKQVITPGASQIRQHLTEENQMDPLVVCNHESWEGIPDALFAVA